MQLSFNEKDISIFSATLPIDAKIEDAFLNWIPSSIENAAASRKREFVAGRYCATRAAKELGVVLESLPTSSSRAPVWPEGLVGSISHSKKLAISCVTKNENFRSVGIDAEEMLKEGIGIEGMIAVASELEMIRQHYRIGLTVLFSGKEALYKALNPLVHCYIDFKEVVLKHIDFENKYFELELMSLNPSLKEFLGVYSGSFEKQDETIVTLIKIPNA